MLSINDIKKRIIPICAKYGVKQAILFGSYVKGNATKNSDIDIYLDSGLRGLKFVELIESLRQSLDNIEVDALDKKHIQPNSLIDLEIHRTGVEVYAK